MTTAEGASAPQLPGFTHLYSGKVRDLYAPLDAAGRPDPEHLLLVASDRISAFDYVLDSLIPDKGAILTQLSLWWFDALADLCPTMWSPPTCRPPWPGGRSSCGGCRCCRLSASRGPT